MTICGDGAVTRTPKIAPMERMPSGEEFENFAVCERQIMSTKVSVRGCTVNLGMLSLVALVMQNSSLVLMTRWAAAHRASKVNTGVLVFTVEIVKMVFCMFATIKELKAADPRANILERIPALLLSEETGKLCVPAALFTLQNYLIFVSLANLDATTFQVLSQVKLFLAAIFSVWFLHKYLSCIQWMSIILLVFGICVAGSGRTQHSDVPNNLLGVAACLVSGTSSSFAGVYFEKILKVLALFFLLEGGERWPLVVLLAMNTTRLGHQ